MQENLYFCHFKIGSQIFQNKDNYLSSVFNLLTGNRILDACQTAVENQDFRMALLLAQSSGGNFSMRQMINQQVADWFRSGVRTSYRFYFLFCCLF